MSVAPHDVLCPWKATGMPPTSTLGLPSTMTQKECPLIGQVHASPFLATAIPWTNAVGAAAITLPPWLVASPSRITLFILSFESVEYGSPAAARKRDEIATDFIYRSAIQRQTVRPYTGPRLAIVLPSSYVRCAAPGSVGCQIPAFGQLSPSFAHRSVVAAA